MTEPTRSALRHEVERRAKGRCEYCQSPAKYATQRFALDHIIPRSQGGDTSLTCEQFCGFPGAPEEDRRIVDSEMAQAREGRALPWHRSYRHRGCRWLKDIDHDIFTVDVTQCVGEFMEAFSALQPFPDPLGFAAWLKASPFVS